MSTEPVNKLARWRVLALLWLKRLQAKAQPFIMRATFWGQRRWAILRAEAMRRGTSPRAWLGAPRLWIDYRRRRFWAVTILVAYLLIGFFLLPWIAKREIIAAVGKTYDRPVQLERMRINPILWSAELRGFRITEKDGAKLLGFERLYLRFELTSLLRWAWCFQQIRLEGFRGDLIRYTPADTNIGRFLQSGASPEPAAKSSGLPRLVIGRLRIRDAQATFTDNAPATRFTTTIGPINIAVNHVSTLSEAVSRLPRKKTAIPLHIEFEGGATAGWTGTFGLNPLISSGHLSSRGPFPALLARYFRDRLRIEVPSGEADSDVDYQLVTRPDGGLALTASNARFAMRHLALRAAGEGEPFLRLDEMQLAGGHLAWPEQNAGAEQVTVGGLDLALARLPDGQLSIQRLMAPQAQAAPALPAQPASGSDWSLGLTKFEMRTSKLRFEDRTLRQPGAVQLGDVTVDAGDLSNKPGASFPVSVVTEIAPGGQLKLMGHVAILPEVALEAKLTAAGLKIAGAALSA
jgi:hypothetical protein